MKYAALFAMLLVSPLTAWASGCPQNFLDGREPHIVKESVGRNTRELCNSEYGTTWSSVSRTPLWSAEHLTRERIAAAKGLPRTNDFHEDDRLPQAERSWLGDYARSGFDRGHVAPNGDMSNPVAQTESFSLSNMVPQVAENNRGIWAGIEGAVRNLVNQTGEVWVVTGPVFRGSQLRTTPSGRVLVPSDMFKAIYVPSTGQSGVYLSPNDASGSWSPISVNGLMSMTGFDPFPALTKGRDASMDLPKPRERFQH